MRTVVRDVRKLACTARDGVFDCEVVIGRVLGPTSTVPFTYDPADTEALAVSVGHWLKEHQVDTTQLPAYEAPRPLPSAVKAEAQRRILVKWPYAKQLNAMRGPDEEREAMSAWIDGMRQRSNELEQSRPPDFTDDKHWVV